MSNRLNIAYQATDEESELDSFEDSSDSDDMDVFKNDPDYDGESFKMPSPPSMKCVCENCGNAIEGDVYQGYTAMNFHATTQSPKNSRPIRTKRL